MARKHVLEHRKTGGGESAVDVWKLTPRKEKILSLIGGWDVIEGEAVREIFETQKPKSTRQLFPT